jgi:hypothetical protein
MVIKELVSIATNYKQTLEIRRFYKKNFSFKQISTKIILIEAFQVPSNEISILYFLTSLKSKKDFSPVAFYFNEKNRLNRLKIRVKYLTSPMYSAGIRRLIIIDTHTQHPKLNNLKMLKSIYGINSNYDLENFTHSNILIGDLLYDEFLSDNQCATIDIDDIKCYLQVEKFILLVNQFNMIFLKFDIEAVLVSHCVYKWAIPARIAVANNVSAYQVTGESIYRISNTKPFAYTDFFDYPQIFSSISDGRREVGLRMAKTNLDRRFAGEVGVDMPYSTKSAFTVKDGDDLKENVLKVNSKIKILVAVHDFYDSPHPFGFNFYPDIYLWLESLALLSNKVNFDWYIKTHPDIQGIGKKILEDFCNLHPQFNLLPADTSHLNIIKDGINFVLTIWGTVAVEYSYFNIPVINASKNNPHASYKFSITPNSREEYESLILNLDKLVHPIEKAEIYEYYFMNNIYKTKSILFTDYDRYLKEIGGYKNSMSHLAYEYFLKSDNTRKPSEIITANIKFIESNFHCLQPNHQIVID